MQLGANRADRQIEHGRCLLVGELVPGDEQEQLPVEVREREQRLAHPGPVGGCVEPPVGRTEVWFSIGGQDLRRDPVDGGEIAGEPAPLVEDQLRRDSKQLGQRIDRLRPERPALGKGPGEGLGRDLGRLVVAGYEGSSELCCPPVGKTWDPGGKSYDAMQPNYDLGRG